MSWIDDKVTRDMIGAWIESVANNTVAEHFSAITQEAQLSSRVGQALENAFPFVQGISQVSEVFGYQISVVTQDIPDRGRGALEKQIGADLYVGFEIRKKGGERLTKGLFVQVKWDDYLDGAATIDLRKKCNGMLKKTKSSYVWVYSEDGIKSLPAGPLRRKLPGRIKGGAGIGPLISNVLECTEGDPDIGLPVAKDAKELRRSLGEKLMEFAIPTGVAVAIKPPN